VGEGKKKELWQKEGRMTEAGKERREEEKRWNDSIKEMRDGIKRERKGWRASYKEWSEGSDLRDGGCAGGPVLKCL
jgi:hypothetical protein